MYKPSVSICSFAAGPFLSCFVAATAATTSSGSTQAHSIFGGIADGCVHGVVSMRNHVSPGRNLGSFQVASSFARGSKPRISSFGPSLSPLRPQSSLRLREALILGAT
jgi:hypothetical protein